jgi:hypothetical protein
MQNTQKNSFTIAVNYSFRNNKNDFIMNWIKNMTGYSVIKYDKNDLSVDMYDMNSMPNYDSLFRTKGDDEGKVRVVLNSNSVVDSIKIFAYDSLHYSEYKEYIDTSWNNLVKNFGIHSNRIGYFGDSIAINLSSTFRINDESFWVSSVLGEWVLKTNTHASFTTKKKDTDTSSYYELKVNHIERSNFCKDLVFDHKGFIEKDNSEIKIVRGIEEIKNQDRKYNLYYLPSSDVYYVSVKTQDKNYADRIYFNVVRPFLKGITFIEEFNYNYFWLPNDSRFITKIPSVERVREKEYIENMTYMDVTFIKEIGSKLMIYYSSDCSKLAQDLRDYLKKAGIEVKIQVLYKQSVDKLDANSILIFGTSYDGTNDIPIGLLESFPFVTENSEDQYLNTAYLSNIKKDIYLGFKYGNMLKNEFLNIDKAFKNGLLLNGDLVFIYPLFSYPTRVFIRKDIDENYYINMNFKKGFTKITKKTELK